jgi:hypothetical protein
VSLPYVPKMGSTPIADLVREDSWYFTTLMKFTEAALSGGRPVYGGACVQRAEEAISAIRQLFPRDRDADVDQRVINQRLYGRKSQTQQEREMNSRAAAVTREFGLRSYGPVLVQLVGERT